MSQEQQPRALIVDDEPDIRELLELTLARMDIGTRSAANAAEARRLLGEETFSLCLTDMRLPDGSGIDLVRHTQQHHPDLPIAVITAHGSMDAAVEALKAGAFDFVSKPIELKTLRELVKSALRLGTAARKPDNSRALLGTSPAMEKIRSTVSKLARSQAPVYISGESGTGKELVARLIHEQGPRFENPFVPVNCGAIPAELMESELFGHKKGSFTGANSDKEGLFQAARGGTLFLDEVADLPLDMQVKLLRAIQEKAVRAVGAQSETPVDVRILSATHRDLSALVREGKFRDDLFYRINVIELPVPPLRERREDIPVMVDHTLRRLADRLNLGELHLTEAAAERLRAYDFPGNVRELENILERAVTLAESDLITEQELGLPRGGPRAQTDPVEGDTALDDYLETMERDAIVRALEQTDYNKTAAAKLLGLSFRSLRYRLKKLGLD